MHSREDWDDLRFVLAVAEQGSVSAAARLLGVNHATVLRRIAAFEERSGTEIFDKSVRGYSVLPDRLRVIDAAREVQNAVMGIDRAINGIQAPLQGIVRVTSTDTFCHLVLPEIIAEVLARAPGLRIDLMSTNAHLNLSRLDADITVRPALLLSDDLRGEPAGAMRFDVYARRGAPTDRWLAISGPLARSVVSSWLAENVAAESVIGTADSFVTLAALALAGAGQVILPCILGDSDPRLERRRGVIAPLEVPIWVASHHDLYSVPRIRTVRQILTGSLLARAPALSGGSAPAVGPSG